MSAKEMFEELGYKKTQEDEQYISYYEADNIIDFCKFDKSFKKYWWCYDRNCEISQDITLEELQAINKQVEELGWNNA